MDDQYFITKGSALLSESDGRKLAAAMLREFDEYLDSNDHTIEARYRQGLPQKDTLARYLRVIMDQGNPAVEDGFIAVLTDFLGSGGITKPEFYESLDDSEIKREFTEEERE